MIEEKNCFMAGADERTPSHPQYFSWLNNTNEGSTEAQTLVNLAYFSYLYRKYGMILEIYAWDAGNLDGACNSYQTLDSEKIKSQFPNGYAPIAEAAKKIGCRLGIWCGPDGFGDTEKSVKERIDLMVSLCRDYHFMEFKMDHVCGDLAEQHRDYFVSMMKECRKYSPDLILLNHRLHLGEEGTKYATTFLWNGVETYVDVHVGNTCTAPHHRAFIMDRGNTAGLRRLVEDHGVCISSCIDYFEDDLILQAFGRCLILAPEIYGNPWLMRDDEQARLARIYNFHRRYRDILVNGMLLPGGGRYPEFSVSRGSAFKRFIVTGNQSWRKESIYIHLDLEIGLAPCEKVTVISHHPYEKYIGEFHYGDICELEIFPFRACLIEVCDSREADVMLTGCEYEVLHENESGKIDEIKIVSSTGNIAYSDGRTFERKIVPFDNTLRVPKPLGFIEKTVFADVPENAALQLETALFIQDHDSLEARSLRRSGATRIPEVQAARDAFFNQTTYRLRGCESRFAFDGNDNTFFDGISKTFFGGLRKDGGCLRVDFGAEYDADFFTVEYFDIDVSMDYEVKKQIVPSMCDHSLDMEKWTQSMLEEIKTLRHETADVLIHEVHNIVKQEGCRCVASYPIGGAVRYIRMPNSVDRIYKIALVKDGTEITIAAPRANNLMPYQREVVYAKEMTVNVSAEDWREGCYLSVGLEGEHGNEGAYAVLEIDGQYIGAPDRAPGYLSNVWESVAGVSNTCDHHYTYYFPIAKEMCGKDFKIRILGLDREKRDYGVSVYLCDKNAELNGVVCSI